MRPRGCFDCMHIRGMICCKFDNGTEDCEYAKKCPSYVDKNAISSKKSYILKSLFSLITI